MKRVTDAVRPVAATLLTFAICAGSGCQSPRTRHSPMATRHAPLVGGVKSMQDRNVKYMLGNELAAEIVASVRAKFTDYLTAHRNEDIDQKLRDDIADKIGSLTQDELDLWFVRPLPHVVWENSGKSRTVLSTDADLKGSPEQLSGILGSKVLDWWSEDLAKVVSNVIGGKSDKLGNHINDLATATADGSGSSMSAWTCKYDASRGDYYWWHPVHKWGGPCIL